MRDRPTAAQITEVGGSPRLRSASRRRSPLALERAERATRLGVLPVKNGADRLRELLPRVLEQETSDCVEFVAVDSGSTDDTVDVLREFGATVISIQASAFNHGLTRNLAADFARGDVFVYLNRALTGH